MAEETVRLVAVMEAQLRGFTKGMEQAAAEADRRFGQMEKRMNQTERLFSGSFSNLSGLARKFGLSLSVASAVIFAKGIIDAADALKDASDQLGITTQELQALNSAARDTGAGTDRMKQGLASLSDQLGDAVKGEGNLAKLLRDLNIPLGTTMQVFFDLADATKKAATQNEKMSISTLAFGKAGKELVPLLNQGADGVRKLFDEAQKKGQIWDPETVKKLDNLNDAWERLKVSLTGKVANPLAGFLEYIQGLTPKIDILRDQLRRIEREPGGASRPSAARLRSQIAALNDAVPFRGTPLLPPSQARTTVPQSAADREKTAKAAEDAITTFEETVNRLAEEANKKRLDEEKDFRQRMQDAIDAGDQREAESLQEFLDQRQEQINQADQKEAEALQEFKDKRLELIDEADTGEAERLGKKQIDVADRLRESFDITGAAGVRAFDNIGDAAKQLLQQLTATALQLAVIEPLMDALFGKKGDPLGGVVGAVTHGLLGFAGGGSPPVGVPSLVGERGPELFVPRVPGTIIPNGGVGGGSHFYIDARGAQVGVAEQIAAAIKRAAPAIVGASVSTVKGHLPGMMQEAQARFL